ncbi:MAG: glycosyltransferase family 2 protein [Vicinamibacteria bacterium]
MRLWGVAMVRNESDIVEAFVRHALGVLDGLIVLDHASSDETPRILASLCEERLPLVVERSDHVGYLQAEITTALVRKAFALGGADAVFPLDADEFPRVPSRARLEDALRALPADHIALEACPIFLPPLNSCFDVLAQLRAARRLRAPLVPPASMHRKAVLGPAFAAAPTATLTMGNHSAVLGDDSRTAMPMPATVLDASVVEICHVPVRSAPQFVVKTAVKRLARVAAGRDYVGGTSKHVAYEAIRRGVPLTPALMLAAHALVDDAMITATLADPPDDAERFLGEVVLRYTRPASTDPLPHVIAAVDAIVRSAVAARARAAAA